MKKVSKPKTKPVDSSYLQSVRYDPTARTLWVRFTDGAIVAYLYVTPQTYQALMDADSHGDAFIRLIRDKHTFNVVKSAT